MPKKDDFKFIKGKIWTDAEAKEKEIENENEAEKKSAPGKPPASMPPAAPPPPLMVPGYESGRKKRRRSAAAESAKPRRSSSQDVLQSVPKPVSGPEAYAYAPRPDTLPEQSSVHEPKLRARKRGAEPKQEVLKSVPRPVKSQASSRTGTHSQERPAEMAPARTEQRPPPPTALLSPTGGAPAQSRPLAADPKAAPRVQIDQAPVKHVEAVGHERQAHRVQIGKLRAVEFRFFYARDPVLNDSETCEGHLLDLSEGGISFLGPAPANVALDSLLSSEIMAEISLRLPWIDGEERLFGRAIRVEDVPEDPTLHKYALKFHDVTAAAAEAIRRLVALDRQTPSYEA